MKKNWSAIIPAAGKSKRFESKKSKILYKYKKKTIIEHIVDKVKNKVKDIIIISNKKNYIELKRIFKNKKKNNFKIILQSKKNGMAIAIQTGLKHTKTKFFCSIWGDQIGLTDLTISRLLNSHQLNKFSVTLPVLYQKKPYVNAIIKKNYFLDKMVQSRETGFTEAEGFSDCGFFCCNTSFIKNRLNNLIRNKKIVTKKTNEYDFLLALNILAKKNKIKLIKTINKKDAVGINKINDLKKI